MEEADKTQGKKENKLDGSCAVDVEPLESSQGENLTEHADHALLTTEPRGPAEEGESGTTEQPAPSTQQEGAEEMEHTAAPHTTTEQTVQTASEASPAREVEGDTVEGTAQTQPQIQIQYKARNITEPPAHGETEDEQPTETRESEQTGTEEMELVVVREVRPAGSTEPRGRAASPTGETDSSRTAPGIPPVSEYGRRRDGRYPSLPSDGGNGG